ncbi:Na+/H+ antiporter subunit E [Pleomorphochaeta sp. DL1XJH-081]|uniref:Na+/H+ antiporter subunit E n=1 Tax=Pleomorphochaeta sp. DL1XJH-081 TaxID=3409690 RepID=UPI003BB4E257
MSIGGRWKVIRFLFTTLFLFGVWLLFTSSLELYSVLFGFMGSVIIGALTYNVFIAQHQANIRYILPNPLSLVIFVTVLVFQLYQSSFIMLKAVFTKKASPRIVHFRTRLKSDLARMTLANSITMTPGTITLDLNDDHLTVHWFFCDTNHAKAAGEEVKGRIEKFIGNVWL